MKTIAVKKSPKKKLLSPALRKFPIRKPQVVLAQVPLPERKRRAKTVDRMLQEFYPNPPHPLDHKDAFTLLVAVMLSAQTTDVHVNKVTPALFKKGDTAAKLAKLSVSEILEAIRGVNFAPTKAKNLKALSEQIVERHGGKVPSTFEELEALPGIGHKSASVVLGDYFRLPAFPVDTHIHRLARRWRLSTGKNVESTEADLKEVFPSERWHKLHIQIIYYGRNYCTARGCDGFTCPICKKLNT